MADEVRLVLAELRLEEKAEPGLDALRESERVLAEVMMDLEVEQHLGEARHVPTPDQFGQRNSARKRIWDTGVGTIP